METTKTEGNAGNGQVAATTIYDAVKITIFQHYCTALGIHAQCRERQLKGADGRAEAAFMAAITALYIDAAPKLRLYLSQEKCDALKQLIGAQKEMTFYEAEELFMMLREFMELNGITKYEWKRTTPEQYTLEGMIRK